MKNPWLKFFPADWRADPRVRMCSLAARGLWFEMLCVMHESSPYGHLLIGGKSPADAQLAVLAGTDAHEISSLLSELEGHHVFSRTKEGVIYSRRMIRDEKRASLARKNGRRGGNPALFGNGAEHPDKAALNGGDKLEKPEAINQNPSLREGASECAPRLPELNLESEKEIKNRLWREGVRFLVEMGGMSEKPARSFIGKCLRLCGDDYLALLQMIDAARLKGTRDPQSYIMAALVKPQKERDAALAKPGEWRDGKIWLTREAFPENYQAWEKHHKSLRKFLPQNGAFLPSEWPPQTFSPASSSPSPLRGEGREGVNDELEMT